MKKITFSFLLLTALICVVGACFTLSFNQGSKKLPLQIQQAYGKSPMIPVAIIGSGPAGSTAGLYTARAGIVTVIFEGAKPGGLLTETSDVENYCGVKRINGQKLIDTMKEQAHEFGAIYMQDTIEKIDCSSWPFKLSTSDGNQYYALTVIYAAGAEPRKLHVPGEQEFWGMGVTSCAVCDAPFYKDEEVVVVGGGDSAVEEAIQLVPYAKKITLLVRKSHMRAAQSMQDRLNRYPSIHVLYNVEIEKIVGSDEGVIGVNLCNDVTQERYFFSAKGVFLAIGHDPNTTIINKNIELDAAGYIKVKGRSQKTNVPGFFAAGDVEDSTYRQAIVAAGSGCKAGLDADAFLQRVGYSVATQNELNLFDPKTKSVNSKAIEGLTTCNELDSVLKNTEYTLVEFYTDTCPSCKQIMPIVESVTQEQEDICVVKINAEDAEDIVITYHVPRVPSLLFFKGTQLLGRINSIVSRAQLCECLKRYR